MLKWKNKMYNYFLFDVRRDDNNYLGIVPNATFYTSLIKTAIVVTTPLKQGK